VHRRHHEQRHQDQGPEGDGDQIGRSFAEALGRPGPDRQDRDGQDCHDAEDRAFDGHADHGHFEQQIALGDPVDQEEGQHRGDQVEGHPVQHIDRGGIAEGDVLPDLAHRLS